MIPPLRTLPQALAASERGGVVLQMEGDRRLTWSELGARADAFAAGLSAAGLAPGDRAILILPSSLDLLDAFFGCARAGVVPCQLSAPEGFGAGPGFDRRLLGVVELLTPALVITDAELAPRLRAALPGGPAVRVADTIATDGPAPETVVGLDDLAFIQLTSGTTAAPKGVQITHRSLATNAEQISLASEMDAESVVVSWLPMFHDMGLVGFLTSLYRDLTGVLLRPATFLRRPQAWLRAISDHRGSHSPAPTFAFRYTVERLSRRPLKEPLDLSSWRAAYVGAEPIRAEVLRAFEELLAPHGLSPTTVLPCYGMAEATLALTFKPAGQSVRVVRVDRAALAEGVIVVDPDGLELVSCGVPLPPTTVSILGPDGAELPENRIGEVVVDGPSLFRGYYGHPPREGALRTGDLGFLRDGELFITGREKDIIIIRGHNHHPEEVEWVAAQVKGVRAGRVAAFGLPDVASGTEQLCLLAERDKRSGVEPEALVLALRRAVHTEAGLPLERVRLLGAGELPVTTSGKVQRSHARALFEQLEAEGA